MSVISDDYFQLIQNKIAEHHNVMMHGVIQPPYYQVQNRAALIFTLEVVLDAYRQKHGTLTNPLKGKLALEHLILTKFKWPLKEIRALTLNDALFVIHDELRFENLPDSAQTIIKNWSAHRARLVFDQVVDQEWDPELYLQQPQQKNW